MGSSSIEILELTGTSPRSVTLIGPWLPHMGAEWGRDYVVPTTFYNGNPEATQQVLGPKELPSSWTGEWHRTMTGRAPAIYSEGSPVQVVEPEHLVEILESIFAGGNRLRVTWAAVPALPRASGGTETMPPKVREGRATSAKFTYTRMEDVAWSITFAWASRSGESRPKVTDTRAASVPANSAAFQQKMQALVDANRAAQLAKFSPGSLSLGQLENLASYPTKLADDVGRQVERISTSVAGVVKLAATVRDQPLHVVNAAIDSAHNLVARANRFSDVLGRTPPELLTQRMKAADLARASKTFGTVQDATQQLARAAQAYVDQLRQTVAAGGLTGTIAPTRTSGPRSIQRAYVTRAGDTPTRVSQREYGSPDHAVDILRANRMPWYLGRFEPGVILIIPALGSGAAVSGGV